MMMMMVMLILVGHFQSLFLAYGQALKLQCLLIVSFGKNWVFIDQFYDESESDTFTF